MKKEILIALSLSLVLVLSACGAPSGGTPSDSGTQNTPSAAVPDNTPANDAPASGDHVTDDFLKTITVETAEAKGVCGPDVTWYYQDNVLVIKGTGEMSDYMEFTVSSPWKEDSETGLYKQIHWVIIQEGVTSIGNYAFQNCNVLSKIELPNTIEKIGQGAFIDCPFEKITIPASVTYIENCSAKHLKEITFLGDAPEGTERFIEGAEDAEKIYYSGNGFDELTEKYPDIEWIKQ